MIKDDRQYLLAHGWKEADTLSVCRWWKPPLKGTYYTLTHAVELQRVEDRERKETFRLRRERKKNDKSL